MNPFIAIICCVMLGATLGIAGVFVLFGPGWALLFGSALAFMLGAILMRGMRRE